MLIKAALRFQAVVGAGFVVFGFILSFIVIDQHGMGSGPLYDRSGIVMGTVNYLLVSIGVGAFSAVLGAAAVIVARRTLRKLS